MTYDFIVIGGGIVGLATALTLAERRPGAAILVLEKEQALALHQTGRNSGVIHSGIYYAEGSLKAKLCREGAEATMAFCRDHGVPVARPGKLLVATSPVEMARLGALETRAAANAIAIERLDARDLAAAEPAVTGLGALLVPSTGIVDYGGMCAAIAALLRDRHHVDIRCGAAVTAIRETADGVSVRTGDTAYETRQMVACAGLQSDRIARLAGLAITHRIIPFRGDYYEVVGDDAPRVQRLIYPVPDPDLPFLGIHLTLGIDGRLTVGPNAVLALARERYGRFSVDIGDLADVLRFSGFRRVVAQHWRNGLVEFGDSLFKAAYLEKCRKYCPSLEMRHLVPHPAGIRAQAVLSDGTLVHDFLFERTARSLHVCNAPSPAATSALPIGAMIADALLGAPAN